jgi:hypothetical protein
VFCTTIYMIEMEKSSRQPLLFLTLELHWIGLLERASG